MRKEKFICKNCGNVENIDFEKSKDFVNWKCEKCFEMMFREGYIGTNVIWKTDTGTVSRKK